MATDAEAIKAGFALPTGADLIKNGDNAITQNAKATVDGLAALKVKRPNIQPGADLNSFYGEAYGGQHPSLVASTTATLLNLPQDLIDDPRGFVLDVRTVGEGTIQQLDTYYWPAKRYIRNSAPSSGTGWTAWKSVLFEGDIQEQEQTPQERGYKTVPLILTSPANASGTETVAAGSLRFPVRYAVPISRWRLHVQNINDRAGTKYSGAVNFNGIWLGTGSHTTGAFLPASNQTQVAPAFTTPANGDEYVSPWISREIQASTDMLISVGYANATGQANVASIATVWRTPVASNSNVSAPSTLVKGDTAPFNIWIEAEVPSTVPVVAELASSGGVGAGATNPIIDSGLSQYCRIIGALPMHYAHSGSTLGIWKDPAHHKWQKWLPYARPDAMYISLGSNDLFGSATLAEVQASAEAVFNIARDLATANLYATTIPPRTAAGDETTRHQYNTWLRTKPLGIRDVFEVSAALSSDDETIRPEFDADGIHANAAGGLAKAKAISRAIVEPYQRYRIEETAGRTVKVWDYINNREQMIYGDTGYRALPNDPAKTGEVGNVIVRRVGSMVELSISDKTVVVGGNVTLLTLPAGFRPWAWVNTNLTTIYDSVAPTPNGLRITTAGDVMVYSVSAGEVLRGQVVFMTPDPWPTSLPGIANGATP